MAIPQAADPRAIPRLDELSFCRKVINYFLKEEPTSSEFKNVPLQTWLLFLQSRFPNPDGKWLDISDSPTFDLVAFLKEIDRRLDEEIQQLDEVVNSLAPGESLPPSLPPNLKQLVKEYEAAAAKKAKAAMKEKALDINKLLWHQWELKRNQLLLDQLRPSLQEAQKTTTNEVTTSVTLISHEPSLTTNEKDILKEASKSPDLLSSSLEKTLQSVSPKERDRLLFGEEEQTIEQTKKIYQETVRRALTAKGITAPRAEEIASKARAELDDPSAKLEISRLKSAFQEQTRFQNLVDFQEKRVKFLEFKEFLQETLFAIAPVEEKTKEALVKINQLTPLTADQVRKLTPSLHQLWQAKGGDQENRLRALEEKTAASLFKKGTEIPQITAEATLKNFIFTTLQSRENDFANIGLSRNDLLKIANNITNDVLAKTVTLQDLFRWMLSENEFLKQVQKILGQSLLQNLNWLKPGRIKSFFSPSARRRRKEIEKIIEKIDLPQKVQSASQSLFSSLETASVQNISAIKTSSAEGHPYGRVPEVIKLMILKTEAETLKKFSPDQFAAEFQQSLIDSYGAAKNLTASQKASIKNLFRFMQFLQEYNPRLANMLRFYGQHQTALMVARGTLGFFLKYPDFILHLPVIYGKMFLQSWLTQDVWALRWKPKIISSLNKIPGLGGLFRFWYGQETNEFGLFTPLPERIRKKILETSLRKGIHLTGKAIGWLGKKLGKSAWINLGRKLTSKAALATLGGFGAAIGLVVAFWPQIKDFIKRSLQALGLWFLGLLAWAAQKGPWVLGGLGVGFVGGIPAGIAAGKATFALTIAPLTAALGPIAGPIAAGAVSALAGLAAWGASAGVGALLGYFAQGIWIKFSGWAQSAFSSISGAAAESLGLAGRVEAAGLTAELAGTAKTVLAISGGLITGLYFYTQLINTSSLLPPEGLEFLIGSKYIEIEKGAQVGEEADKNQFENRYHLPNDICDPPAKSVYYQIGLKVTKDLTEIKITDKTVRSGEYGSVTVQEKSWQIDALGKGETWQSEVYGFTLTPDFKDSYLSNTVTVTTAEGEEKTATLTLKIGSPPAPPLAQAARQIIDALISCYNTHQINKSTLTDNGQCLLEKQIPQNAVNEILRSVSGYVNLQCVGLVIAATQMAGQPLEPHNAIDYYGKDFGNYHWHPNLEMDNIREGDIFVSAKSPGHLAVVYEVNLNGFRLAEAFGNSCAQEGPYATLCAGYVRYQDGTFITFDQAKNRGEIGYLRYGE